MKRTLFAALFALAASGPALAADPPSEEELPTYEAVKQDGVWIVTKDGGKSQVGGVHISESTAKAEAKRLNNEIKRDAKKDAKKDK
jgi:opacity protein-like surface antigen